MPQTLTVADLTAWLREFGRLVREQRDYLTDLDAAIGDADHGTNMDRGMSAVVSGLDENTPATAGALFKQVGMALVSKVGGASGPLFGTFFLRFGTALGETTEVSPDAFQAGLTAGLEGVVARGRAESGDKTMYDALAPADTAFSEALVAGSGLGPALRAAASAAAAGRDATIPMTARKGRASYLGERSVGHQDPGATTVVLLLDAAVDTLGGA